VEKAAALRSEISAALRKGDSVSLDFSSVEDMDLSCLQVLYASLVAAKASGKRLRFAGLLSDRLAERLKACGFLSAIPSQAADLETAMGLLS
jgi:anti-anti-sigma regulatory factor